MEIKNTWKFIVIGSLAGCINGFFGGGGGIALLPLFTLWAKMDGQRAFATSVASILPMCAVSAAVYAAHSGVSLAAALPYLIGGVVGGVLGGVSLKKLPVTLLRKLFALLLIIGGVNAIL